MSDVLPNYELEQQRLELERDQLQLNIKSQNYRIAQLHDEEARITENITATKEAIKEMDIQIQQLTKEK